MKNAFTTPNGRDNQKIKRAFGRDDSSFPVNDGEARDGKKMGGGINNLSHSLTGASAVQDVKGKKEGGEDE